MKEFILELDKPRRLKYGFGAARLIREKLGDREITELMKMKLDEMPIVAWAGLRWEDPEITIERVEELLDAALESKYNMLSIVSILVEAIAEYAGVSSGKNPKAGKEPAKRIPTSRN